MNKIKTLALLLLVAFTMPLVAQGQQIPELPKDDSVRYGKLANGLTYYVRHNALPEKRVHFYIAQKVGSVQEEESQRGLAHFLEHMCFNGSEHFAPGELVKYCERIGVQFGGDLNAYTSTDETVYNIDNVPVSESNIDSCMYILYDWANGLTLPTEEIDKERGVIHEEWRMRSSAQSRILERNLEKLYPGSRYGKRYPIGLMSVVDNFKPQELRNYYEKWYRPDLQALVIVGDIDADAMVEKIKQMFSSIEMPANPAKFEHYPVPTTPEAIYVVDKDPEMGYGLVQLMFKSEPLPEEMNNTIGYFVKQYIDAIITSSLNSRLKELSQKADCPFSVGQTAVREYIMSKTMESFEAVVLPKDGKDAAATKAVMQEIERAVRYGITGTEILRARDNFMSDLETEYNNRTKQEHSYYIPTYYRSFLDNSPMVSTEMEYNIYQQVSKMITADVINQTLKAYASSIDTNFVCIAMYPDKEGVVVPTEAELRQAVKEAHESKLEAYVDNVKNEPLVPELPAKGQIAKEESAPFGYTVWTLANGARVYFKQTDFNDSEVLFNARSVGGSYKVADKDIDQLKAFDGVINATGVGNFTSTELEKVLAGKQVSLSVTLDRTEEALDGKSTPKDLRTLFELIYLRFQKPTYDKAAFDNTISMLRSSLANAEKVPIQSFSDSLVSTLYAHNPRMEQMHLADIDNISYDEILKIYADRFASAGDFDFFFTGNFSTDSLRLFVEQYIAPLKGVTARETMTDLNIYPVKGVVENRYQREMETPQCYVYRIFSGEVPYTTKNDLIVDILGQVLTQRYLKSIREDSGIAYSVGANGSCKRRGKDTYTVLIGCPVKPAQVDDALRLMDEGLADLAAKGVKNDELDKAVKYLLKTTADSQRKNEFWQGGIVELVTKSNDAITNREAIINSITSADIQSFVNDVLLKQNNRATVIMLPASLKE